MSERLVDDDWLMNDLPMIDPSFIDRAMNDCLMYGTKFLRKAGS
ncbi:hypothetical protein ACIRL0_30175 [Streptomyces sp. NPDC102365]